MESEDSEALILLLERLTTGTEPFSEDEVTSLLNNTADACHVPRRDTPEDVPYDAAEFEGVAREAETQLCIILRVLDSIHNAKEKGHKLSPLFLKNVVVRCVALACEYRDGSWVWSSERAAGIADDILKRLCSISNCDTLQQLLFGSQVIVDSDDSDDDMDHKKVPSGEGYMKVILQKISENLKKTTWKSYPAIKMAYLYLLRLFNHQNIGDHLPYLLPPALFITDDWEQDNKILGLKALHHILINTPSSELRWYGRAAVILDALKPLLHSREIEVLEVLYPTILEAVKILDADPANAGKLRSETHIETVLDQLLREMACEQKLVLRALYSRTLPEVIATMGIIVVRWSQILMEVFREYLSTYDGHDATDRINILKSIQAYVKECWPQIHVNVGDIMKMIIRLTYDITDEDAEIDSKAVEILIQEIECIVQLLSSAAPQMMLKVCSGLTSVPVHPSCCSVLKKISVIVEATEAK